MLSLQASKQPAERETMIRKETAKNILSAEAYIAPLLVGIQPVAKPTDSELATIKAERKAYPRGAGFYTPCK